MKCIFNEMLPENSKLDHVIEEDNFEYISTSIFISNLLFIVKIKKTQEFLIFKIIEKSSYVIEYLGILNQAELEKFNLNDIYYVTPGKCEYELICLNSNGEIFSISIKINENNILTIEKSNSLLNINSSLNHELSSDIIDFKPIYSKNVLKGVVFIENFIEIDENLWLFYKKPDNNILTFSTIVENELFIYNDFREVCHLFFLQDNQVWYLQFENFSEDKIDNFADILSLDESYPVIHDIFFYRNYIYIRTEDFLYKFHSEYLILDKKERVDKPLFVKQSFKSPHILIGKKGELFIRNDPEAEPYTPIFINSDYDEIDLQYENSPKFISIFKSDLIIIKTKKELIFASLFFDKRLTYIIKKKELTRFNFFEELAKKPKEFRERIESQLSFLRKSVEIEIDAIESKQFRPPRIIQFFTKEDDVELINNLYNTKTYDNFAKEWNRNPTGIYFHVKRTFDIPRCNIHPKVDKTCNNCQERINEWRIAGLKKIETIKYRESSQTEIFSGLEKDYYTAFIKKKYLNRLQKTFEFYEYIPKELWNKTIDYIIPLSMVGHSFEFVLTFGLHEVLEHYYNNVNYDSVGKDPMFQYFLIVDKEFHKYWKPNRIAKFMKKHQSYLKSVELTDRILRSQQLFFSFIYTKVKQDFQPFIRLVTEKLSPLLKNSLTLSSQPMNTVVAGLFGKLSNYFPTQFNRKFTQSEISSELQITEVTLRKAIKDEKYDMLDNLIIECSNYLNLNSRLGKVISKLGTIKEKRDIKEEKKKKKTIDEYFIIEDESIEESKTQTKSQIDINPPESFYDKKIKDLFRINKEGLYNSSCGKSYLQKSNLLNHYLKCPECSNLLLRRRTEGNYYCTCGKIYRYSYQLSNHIKICREFKENIKLIIYEDKLENPRDDDNPPKEKKTYQLVKSDFEEFWAFVKNSIHPGKILFTLKEKKPNEIVNVGDIGITVKTEGSPQIITKELIKKAWLNLVKDGVLYQKEHGKSTYHSSFIMALFSQFDFVNVIREGPLCVKLDSAKLKYYEETDESYEKVPKANSGDKKAWFNIGNVLGDLEFYKDAIECYEKALEIDPRFKKAWFNKEKCFWLNKAFIFFNEEKYEKAIECYDRVLEIDPGYKKAWHNKTMALEKLKKS